MAFHGQTFRFALCSQKTLDADSISPHFAYMSMMLARSRSFILISPLPMKLWIHFP
uniref:Uncharacterized protein n=1 Tax=Lotus japonicus TaxID=34305 RepID=I3SMQ7_LOTJA|nr:unknown [Lotus japonicus]